VHDEADRHATTAGLVDEADDETATMLIGAVS